MLNHHLRLQGTLAVLSNAAWWLDDVDLLTFLPPHSLLSRSPLCLPVCFQESGSSCFHSHAVASDLRPQALSVFSSCPSAFRIPPVESFFLAYDRLRTAAPLEEPKPKPESSFYPLLLPSAYNDRDDRDFVLPADLGSPTNPL